jgi:hypothetical protein
LALHAEFLDLPAFAQGFGGQVTRMTQGPGVHETRERRKREPVCRFSCLLACFVGDEDFFDFLKQLAVSTRIQLMKNRDYNHTFTTILLALGLLALSPIAQAVVPAPDGGYPGGNTAEGTGALLSRTTGLYNTAVGIFSVLSLTDGNFCTGVGAGTLLSNTGSSNTATGAGALLSNVSGGSNTADGTFALFSNTATGNTAIGASALLNNTTGGTLGNIQGFDVGPNVAVGWQALESNTLASANTAVGYQALHSFTTGPVGFEQIGLCTAVGFQALANNAATGFGNSGFGYQALMSNADGSGNTAVGFSSLSNNTASGNTAIGGFALFLNTSGGNNTANGTSALFSNDTGSRNTANGNSALLSNTTGDDNTADGFNALEINTTGAGNTAVGGNALLNSTGSFNTALGFDAGSSQDAGSNNVYIGAGVVGLAGENNTIHIAENLPQAPGASACIIGGIFNQTSAGGIPVLINGNGKLGTSSSSRRFKEEIKPMDKASEAILALKPVTFHYKSDTKGTPQFGLIAEEVAEVNPDLVVRDKEGKPYTVRYDQVNAMLLNEFLKEHKRVQELNASVAKQEAAIAQQRKDFEAATAQQRKDFQAIAAEQKKEIQALTATVREQAAQIQKVSARLQVTKPAPQVAANKD